MEEPIIEPVSKELLKSELTPERQLRMTNKSNNEIYIITAHNAPNVMREIGRLREIAFREAGGGTGKPMDIDEFDTCANCYKQLIVWNPEAEEIIGGYRYLLGTDWELDENRQPKLATSHMFHFSDKFINDYMPYTIELGRSFVTLEYQSTRRGAKSLFALDNLWDGLGALTVIKPNVKYFFGKMTMYPSYIRRGRDMILYFLKNTVTSETGCIAPDAFQRVNAQKQEANIKFLINQANIRKSELKNNSVKEFVEMLKKINADKEGYNVENVEIQAYASPDGGVKFNDKLAGNRQNESEKYVKNTLKQTKVNANIDAHYTAQDWDGFQKLVAASNLQDKEVILRVLSMYTDPQEREQQIRNMSAGFQELANGILPELRRSRLIINYETIGRSDDQIKEQYSADATKLSVDELLYSATLEDSQAKQEAIYKKTTEVYPNDYRAYNNLAALALAKGDKEAAKQYALKATSLGAAAPEAQANLGMLALAEGDVQGAERLIAKASGSENVQSALGALNIAKGNYAQAEKDFGKQNTNTAALAQIMNKNYDAASKTLDKVENPNAMTDYLHAIVAARRGNKFAANSYLKEALQKDPSLKQYAEQDLELSLLK